MREHGFDHRYISDSDYVTDFNYKLTKRYRKINIADGLIGSPDCEFLDYSLFKGYNDSGEVYEIKDILRERRRRGK